MGRAQLENPNSHLSSSSCQLSSFAQVAWPLWARFLLEQHTRQGLGYSTEQDTVCGPLKWTLWWEEQIKQTATRASRTLVRAAMQTTWGCSLALTSGWAKREQRERIHLALIVDHSFLSLSKLRGSCEQPRGGAAFPGLLGRFLPRLPSLPPSLCPPLGLSCPLLLANCLETACGCSCPDLHDGWSHPVVSVQWSVLSVNSKNSKGEWTFDDYTCRVFLVLTYRTMRPTTAEYVFF